jgi:signal transduction histidine kinase
MNRLWLQLVASFLVVILLVISVVAAMVYRSVASSFGTYVSTSNMARFGSDLVVELENYYTIHTDWEGVADLLPERRRGTGRNEPDDIRGAQLFVADADGMIVAATIDDWVGQPMTSVESSRSIDLLSGRDRIGFLGEQTPGVVALETAEQQFLRETITGLLLIGAAAGAAALVLGIALSYSLMHPLSSLTEQISHWKLQDADSTLDIRGTEEIQRLGLAFNDLLTRLAEGEALRQRMSADVAHELRTPVTVMRGHMEAMMDGVYPLDAAHLAVAYDQVLHLARLVEDLRLLTQAESRRLPVNATSVDVIPFIIAALERFAPIMEDRTIDTVIEPTIRTAIVHADVHRLQQVLDNLLSNAVRYTPDGATIRVEVTEQTEQIAITIANPSAVPLTDEQVTHLFDRFWRGEDARARDSGGSGLGLAITRELLRLQGGNIRADRVNGDLCMIFTLPKPKLIPDRTQ